MSIPVDVHAEVTINIFTNPCGTSEKGDSHCDATSDSLQSCTSWHETQLLWMYVFVESYNLNRFSTSFLTTIYFKHV